METRIRLTAWLFATFLALVPFSIKADDGSIQPFATSDTWQVFLNVDRADPPAPWNVIPKSLKGDGPKQEPVFPKTVKMEGGSIDLAALNGGFRLNSCAMLYMEFEAKQDGVMQAGAAADWWFTVWSRGKIACSTIPKGNVSHAYTPNDHAFLLPVKAGRNIVVARVIAGSEGWRFVFGKPETQPANLKFEASSDWKPANMDNLAVKAGSALDQSSIAELPREKRFFGLLSGERLSRLTIGPTGRLVAEDQPDVPLRLRGSTLNGSWILPQAAKDLEWKKTFTREIHNAKAQGCNMLRMYCSAARQPLESELDKADFFLAELGKQGVYCILDCFFDRTLRAGWETGESRLDGAMRMFLGDEIVRSSWKRGTEFMMNHVNPYTGLAWKDDPSIAFMLLFNEQESFFYHPKSVESLETQMEIDVKFRQWLERKYNDPRSMAKAWGDSTMTSFAKASSLEYFPWDGKTAKENDYILFCAELSHESARWMRETLRETGYKGLISQYNCSYWLGGQESRWAESQVCIANVYFSHPSDCDNPGSYCRQTSSIGGNSRQHGARYWRSVAAYRNADRPFVETEFNHCYWNPYQHELGAVFGAYSALQGFDGLAIHTNSVFYYVEDFRPGIKPFTVGTSPILRSCEFLSGCLFLRGDVTTSPHRVELQASQDYLTRDVNGGRTVSPEQDKIALLTGFSVAFPWSKPATGVGEPPKPDMVVHPDAGAALNWTAAGRQGGGAADFSESKNAKFSIDDMVASLKEKGVLAKDNISDPANGVYQSDTGEITMRTNENLLKVVTPRSEAVTLEGGKGEPLGKFTLISTSVPALAAACAVDTKDLEKSRRIVVVYATDAVNSGTELSADKGVMINRGKPPVLIKTGALEATLKNENSAEMSLYALGFDGARREKLPLTVENGLLKIKIDTGTLKDGPTTFFELAVD